VTPKLEMKNTGDLRQAKADFAATFAAFREANDTRLAALEAKSAADPLLVEKVDRLNAALDAQTKRVENLTLAQAAPGFGSEVKSADTQAWASFIRTGDTANLEGKSVASRDRPCGVWRLFAPLAGRRSANLSAHPARRRAGRAKRMRGSRPTRRH